MNKNSKGQAVKSSAKKNSMKQTMKSKKISQPVAKGRTISGAGKPKIQYLPSGDIVVEHWELGPDVVSSSVSGNFNLAGYPINPLNPLIFPWLSTIASSWESYVFEKLEFIYETTTTTATTGAIYMAVDFDAADELPNDKRQMLSYRNAIRTEVWCDQAPMLCKKEDLQKRKSYYVAPAVIYEFNSTVPPGSAVGADLRLNNVGNLFLASQAVTGTSVLLGEVVTRYRVRFMTPQQNSFLDTPGLSYYTSGIAGASGNAPFGSPISYIPDGSSANGLAVFDTIGIVYATPGGISTFKFTRPAQSYSVAVDVNGTGLSSINVVNFGQGTTAGSFFTDSTTSCSEFFIAKSAQNLSATGDYGGFQITVTATTVTSAILRATPCPPYTNGTGGFTLRPVKEDVSSPVKSITSNTICSCHLACSEMGKENHKPDTLQPRDFYKLGSVTCHHDFRVVSQVDKYPMSIECSRCGEQREVLPQPIPENV